MPLSDSGKWKPAIYKGGTLTELPRPVLSLEIQDSWDFRTSKVPLDDGETLDGHTFNGPVISVSFQMAKQAGVQKLTEVEMFDLYKSFRDTVNVDTDADKYEFFIYHDTTGSGTYRKFKKCAPIEYSCSFGDDVNALFVASLTVKAEDPVIYTTAPGS